MRLSDPIAKKRPPSGSRHDDPIDVAIALLAPDAFDGTPDHTALGPDQFLEWPPPPEPADYIVTGFPASKQKPYIRDGQLEAPWVTTAVISEETARYRDTRYNPDLSLLLRYDHREIQTSHGGQHVQLKGSSGGAVWRVPSQSELDPSGAKLAAILISGRRAEHQLVATRASLALGMLAHLFPSVVPLVEGRAAVVRLT